MTCQALAFSLLCLRQDTNAGSTTEGPAPLPAGDANVKATRVSFWRAKGLRGLTCGVHKGDVYFVYFACLGVFVLTFFDGMRSFEVGSASRQNSAWTRRLLRSWVDSAVAFNVIRSLCYC